MGHITAVQKAFYGTCFVTSLLIHGHPVICNQKTQTLQLQDSYYDIRCYTLDVILYMTLIYKIQSFLSVYNMKLLG